MPDLLTIEDFKPFQGESFTTRMENMDPVTLTLIKVEPLGQETQPAGRIPFALLFRGPGKIHLEQKIYRLAHGQKGRFDLFLVPVGPDRDGMLYEAIFN